MLYQFSSFKVQLVQNVIFLVTREFTVYVLLHNISQRRPIVLELVRSKMENVDSILILFSVMF